MEKPYYNTNSIPVKSDYLKLVQNSLRYLFFLFVNYRVSNSFNLASHVDHLTEASSPLNDLLLPAAEESVKYV